MVDHRVGVISDTHGLLRSEAMQALQGCDAIIHAGDIGNATILDRLRTVAPVTAVRGNVDAGAWAHGLPKTDVLEIDHIRVYVLHNIAELDLVPEAAGFRVVVSGHSHQPSIREQNGVMFLNPGSAGPRRFHAPVGLALLHVHKGAVDVDLISLDG